MNCPECGSMISDAAERCPNCGRFNNAPVQVNGMPVFSHLLQLSGRRNRQSYLLLRVFTYFFYLPVLMLSVVGLLELNEEAAFILVIVGLILWLPVELLTMAQRFRDIGWTGWAILLLLIPVVQIFVLFALFFVPGSVGPNRYGHDPLA